MVGRAILLGLAGLVVLVLLMFYLGMFMHGNYGERDDIGSGPLSTPCGHNELMAIDRRS
jgi:hypothetical protein